MTLDEYDHHIGFHLRMIQHHTAMIGFHVDDLAMVPAFETVAEDDLARLADALAVALDGIRGAQNKYRRKPVNGSCATGL